MQTEIAIAIEPGLGDHFICNGLVNYVSQFYHKVYLATYNIDVHANWPTVEALYQHCPRVSPVRIDQFVRHWEPQTSWYHIFSTWGLPVMQISFVDIGNPTHWYKSFYHQLLLPWSTWKTHASLPPAGSNEQVIFDQVVGDIGEYILVHDLSTAGHNPVAKLDNPRNLPLIRITPGISRNLFDWRLVMARAAEVHFIQSSVFWLANLMGDQIQGRKFHHLSRPHALQIDPNDFLDWQIVEYDL